MHLEHSKIVNGLCYKTISKPQLIILDKFVEQAVDIRDSLGHFPLINDVIIIFTLIKKKDIKKAGIKNNSLTHK